MWNGENISSGILSQSKNNGDHVFRFHLTFGTSYNPIERYRYQSLAGKFIIFFANNIIVSWSPPHQFQHHPLFH